MKEMGLLSSPLVKILRGHGVICYYCFLFLFPTTPQSWRPNSAWQRCILVVKVGPLRPPYLFASQDTTWKMKLFPHSSLICSLPLVWYLLLEQLKGGTSRIHGCVRKGRLSPGPYWGSQRCLSASSTRREVVIQKSSVKSQLLPVPFTTVCVS